MKKISISCLLILLLTGWPAYSHTRTPLTPPKALATGAATITELSNALLQALQTHQFGGLHTFMLTEAELAFLKRRGSEDLKAIIQNASVEDFRNNLKTQFEALVENGVGRTLNWTEMTITDTQAGKGSPENRQLRPVTLTLTTKQNQAVQVLYEIIKVNKRYYLFQRTQLKT